MPDFLPRRNADLVTWTGIFARRVADDAAALAIDRDQVAELLALQRRYAELSLLAAQNGTRTPAVLTARDTARADLVAVVRSVAAQVRASPEATAEARVAMGLRVGPGKGHGSPIGRPESAPRLHVREIDGRRLRLALGDADRPGSWRKPRGVLGAAVLMRIPSRPTPAGGEWMPWMDTSRTRVTLLLPRDAGLTEPVFLTAAWVSPRLERGPLADPVRVCVADRWTMAA